MKKLHIPAPDHEEEGLGAIEYSLVLTTILAIAVYLGWKTDEPFDPDSVRSNLNPEEVEVVERLSNELRAEKLEAERIDAIKPSERRTRPWTDEEVVATLRFGSRLSNEMACRARSAQIESNTVADQMRLELVKAVDRRGENAPYGCLSLLFFDGKLPQEDLAKEMEEFWTEAESWAGVPRLAGSVADYFRETRDRPESTRFWDWLRVCGVNVDYEGMPSCQQLLFQVSPAQGEDLIMVIDKHLTERGPEIRPSEVALFARTLGVLARNGQPKNFRVTETAELPDYDHDLRDAALFQLCRFVNSPDEAVAEQAARELAQVARYGTRAMGETMRKRWYEACRKAFKATEETPIIAVWDGQLESAPRYDLARPIEAGYCEVKEGFPIWYCGARLWESKDTSTDLRLLFAETSWVEWQ